MKKQSGVFMRAFSLTNEASAALDNLAESAGFNKSEAARFAFMFAEYSVDRMNPDELAALVFHYSKTGRIEQG